MITAIMFFFSRMCEMDRPTKVSLFWEGSRETFKELWQRNTQYMIFGPRSEHRDKKVQSASEACVARTK